MPDSLLQHWLGTRPRRSFSFLPSLVSSRALALFISAFVVSAAQGQGLQIPAPQGYVNDFANVEHEHRDRLHNRTMAASGNRGGFLL